MLNDKRPANSHKTCGYFTPNMGTNWRALVTSAKHQVQVDNHPSFPSCRRSSFSSLTSLLLSLLSLRPHFPFLLPNIPPSLLLSSSFPQPSAASFHCHSHPLHSHSRSPTCFCISSRLPPSLFLISTELLPFSLLQS